MAMVPGTFALPAIKYAVIWVPQNFKKCEINWKSDCTHKDECKWEHDLCQKDYVDAVVTLQESKIPVFSYCLGKDIVPLG
ncbi:hypothetical protein AGMMS50267_13130 [Spirochaetia bacterium]|nr:hypothetical protein AGMMS50267_13130 [Spirochaetia bacterium]